MAIIPDKVPDANRDAGNFLIIPCERYHQLAYFVLHRRLSARSLRLPEIGVGRYQKQGILAALA
jgi:hypothetical protein